MNVVIANVSTFLFLKKPLLNSGKLALLLILWSFLSVLIEVQPLAWQEGGGGDWLAFLTPTYTLV